MFWSLPGGFWETAPLNAHQGASKTIAGGGTEIPGYGGTVRPAQGFPWYHEQGQKPGQLHTDHQAFVTCPKANVTQVHTVTQTATNPCTAHSQESSSLRRQQLLWVLVASVHQSTPTMSNKEKVNAHGQPHEGQPLLYKWQQVREGEGGRGCSGTWGKPGGRRLALRDDPSTAMLQRK